VEATDFETIHEEKELVTEQHEVPKEETAMKKGTQGYGGFRKNLAVACREMTRRVIPARRKGHCCLGQGKDKAVPRNLKGQMFRKRRPAKLEGIME
jgi:hypothetical protein